MSLKANHVSFQPRPQGLTATSSSPPLLQETTSLSQRTVHMKMKRGGGGGEALPEMDAFFRL